jgi:hypothetical protein
MELERPSALRAPVRGIGVGIDWPLVSVLIAASVVACLAYTRFWPQAPHLWWSMNHDRNAHYWAAQSVGIDLRRGDLGHLARDVERMRIWGPLHPLVTGAFLAIFGTDYRLAILTSLVTWVGTAVLAFAAARLAAPSAGNLAGAVAALLVMASGAHQAFATDIMLESPGACLTLAVAYAYLRARQRPSNASHRWLAISLTALFFLKYNYWLIALFAVVAAESGRNTSGLYDRLIDARRGANLAQTSNWLSAQFRHLVSYPLVVVFAFLSAFVVLGPYSVPLPRTRLEVRSGDTLATVACWLVCLRVLPWWLREGRAWLQRESAYALTFVNWHVWPAVCWFLVPKRAWLFASYLLRNHGAGEAAPGLAARVASYTRNLAIDYHAGTAALALVAGLTVLSFLFARRLRPGGAILLWLIAVATGLTLLQPTCRGRFLHSWVAVVWVASGAALAALHGGVPGLLRNLRHTCLTLVVAVLLLVCVPSALIPGHALEGGTNPEVSCALDLPNRFLPQLSSARRVAVISNHPLKFFAMWTYQERFLRTERVIAEPDTIPVEHTAFAIWADMQKCDAVLLINVSAASSFYAPPDHPSAKQIPSLMASQAAFSAAEQWEWPELGCSATLWRRSAPTALAANGP